MAPKTPDNVEPVDRQPSGVTGSPSRHSYAARPAKASMVWPWAL